MSVWLVVLSCWAVGSFPIAVVVGKLLARGERAFAPDDLSVEVDVFLERLFAEGQTA